jgi:hypothetical protein
MEYHVICPCGKQLPVQTDDAGTTIRCQCGQSVAVPSLSKLRTMAGFGAYESSAVETIQRMLDEGTLPGGQTCAKSGRPTQDVLPFEVQLEPDDGWRDRMGFWLAVAYLAGPLLTILFVIMGKQIAARHPENVVTIPLRIDRKFHRGLAWWGTQWKLRRLLSTTPVYARLLEEYPRAIIRVARTPARQGAQQLESPASMS